MPLIITSAFASVAVAGSGTQSLGASTAFIPLPSNFGTLDIPKPPRLHVRACGVYISPNAASDDNHLTVLGGGVTLDFSDGATPPNYLGSFTLIDSPLPPPLLRGVNVGLYLHTTEVLQIAQGIFSPSVGGLPAGVIANVQFSMDFFLSNADTVARSASAWMQVLYEFV
jgi:hypothetical protein